ncbi:deoxyadenosine/deoxycytidine kinase [Paraburkholderia sp. GAS41]|uniref:deoxynucleoside kinase n=1 Tax=Paraburkholderia sp. GAS41 TaxID=3035134 RepID=UPI003D219D61
MRVEICGGIAAGKTTLAKSLALVYPEVELVLENFTANPFWEKFYNDPARYVTEKNICFLAQHTGDMKSISPDKIIICDYAVFQDLAYADLLKDEDHSSTMRKLYSHLYAHLSPLDAIIHVECSLQTQLDRIKARNRPQEKNVTQDYLSALNAQIYHQLNVLPTSIPIHVIKSDDMDCRKLDSRLNDFASLVLGLPQRSAPASKI